MPLLLLSLLLCAAAALRQHANTPYQGLLAHLRVALTQVFQQFAKLHCVSVCSWAQETVQD